MTRNKFNFYFRIVNILSVGRQTALKLRCRRTSSINHLCIYVLGLSTADLLVSLHIPVLVMELIYGQFLFSEAICKMYFFGENVTKVLSSILLVVLSCDRYFAVCHPITSVRLVSVEVVFFFHFNQKQSVKLIAQ